MRSMTPFEKQVRGWLIDDLLRPKHKLFADHFENYDLHLVDDPAVTARVFPKTGLIEVNEDYLDQALGDEEGEGGEPEILIMLIMHELMHLLFQHEKQGVKWIAPSYGINPHKMTKKQYKWLLNKLYLPRFIPTISEDEMGNIKYGPISLVNLGGDWDISKYYSDKHKEISKTLGGLVLELDHPEMKNMSYMELMDEIAKWEREYRRAAMKVIQGNLSKDKATFERDPESEDDSKSATDDSVKD